MMAAMVLGQSSSVPRRLHPTKSSKNCFGLWVPVIWQLSAKDRRFRSYIVKSDRPSRCVMTACFLVENSARAKRAASHTPRSKKSFVLQLKPRDLLSLCGTQQDISNTLVSSSRQSLLPHYLVPLPRHLSLDPPCHTRPQWIPKPEANTPAP